MSSELTYDDFLDRLSIQEVLVDAGYHLNKRDGLRYPSYVRTDSEGRRVRGDKFIVTQNGKCCFQPPQQKVYNVISFIKEHPEMFSENKVGMSPDRLVNLVCNRLLNQPIEDRPSKITEPRKDGKPFNLNDYDIHKFNPQDRETQKRFYPYFKFRGIDLYTQYAFHRHFCLATKHRTDGLTFANLAFPLVLPKTPDKTVGFEERGRPKMDGSGGYKGKAEGSNSSEGLWIANLTGEPLDKASEIVWFESAYDAMAEYQINPVKMVYVSTGGTPTEGQMRGLLSVTPNARHYLGFDKDDAGRQFVANFRKVAAEMGFRHEHVQAYHPLGCYKDWNDALLNKKSAELIAKGEPDTFDYAEFIAAGKAEKQREEKKQEEKKEEKKDEKAVKAAVSPLVQQYLDLKKKHPDAILLFRCGDFYETYKDDAVKASKILGITLTKSNGRKDDEGKPLAMAGFPYHALDTYLPKLIRAGERVAICDQLEMPKQTTSSKRGITEMVSPGKETGKQMAQESQETEQHTSLRR